VNAAYLAIPVGIIGAAIGWGGCWWARAWKAEAPVPYLPTAKADEVLSNAWTAADMEILEGKKLP
jgi:hypothetical protein